MRTTLLLTLLAFHAFNNAMNEDLKSEIIYLLRCKYSLDDAALTTFEPSHQEMNCTQSTLVTGVKIGYNLLPLTPVLIVGSCVAVATGDPVISFIGTSSLLYPLGYYHWDWHMRSAQRNSNIIARHYLPDEYDQHFTVCKQIKEKFDQKCKKDAALAKFIDQEKEKRKEEEETTLRQRFEEQYQKEHQ